MCTTVTTIPEMKTQKNGKESCKVGAADWGHDLGAVVTASFGAVPEVKFMPKYEAVKVIFLSEWKASVPNSTSPRNVSPGINLFLQRTWSKGDISSLKSVMFRGDTQEKILCPRWFIPVYNLLQNGQSGLWWAVPIAGRRTK